MFEGVLVERYSGPEAQNTTAKHGRKQQRQQKVFGWMLFKNLAPGKMEKRVFFVPGLGEKFYLVPCEVYWSSLLLFFEDCSLFFVFFYVGKIYLLSHLVTAQPTSHVIKLFLK